MNKQEKDENLDDDFPQEVINIIKNLNIGDFQYSFNPRKAFEVFIQKYFDSYKRRETRTIDQITQQWNWKLHSFKSDRETALDNISILPDDLKPLQTEIYSQFEKLDTITREEAIILEDYKILFYSKRNAKRATKYFVSHLQKILADTLTNSVNESLRNFLLKESKELYGELAKKEKVSTKNLFFQPTKPNNIRDIVVLSELIDYSLNDEDIHIVKEAIDHNNEVLHKTTQNILRSSNLATRRRLNASNPNKNKIIAINPFKKKKEAKRFKEDVLKTIKLIYQENHKVPKGKVAAALSKEFRKHSGNKSQYITDKLKEYDLDWGKLLEEALGEETLSKMNNRKRKK